MAEEETPIPEEENKLVSKDSDFFNSAEFKQYKKNLGENPTGTADMYKSPYFGMQSSGSIGRGQDKAYESWLGRTGGTEASLKGKSGEDLEKGIIDKKKEKADQKTLAPNEELELEIQEVKDEELLTDSDYDIDAQTIDAPDTIDTEKYKQVAPTQGDAPSYDATQVGDKIGEMDTVEGEVGEDSKITAQQGTVSDESLAVAATEELDAKATVSYQIAKLYEGIESGTELPAWASPAVRKTAALMASRGLGASSMASAAMIQAIYEAGVPIAVADADKYANIQLKNLSNKQQAVIANAATVANMDIVNLNNRQQAEVENAKTFLSMDLKNLDLESTKAQIDFQTTTKGMFTDAAADNAAKQFNAKTQSEIDQFFAELGVAVENTMLNRLAALEQYNISQSTAVEQFNAQMLSMRDQFNSNNRKQIDSSNAVWKRTINTAETAAINEENRTNLLTLLNISNEALADLWQLYRDQAGWAMSTSENNIDRAHNAAMQSAAIDANADMYDEKFDDFLIIETIENIFS